MSWSRTNTLARVGGDLKIKDKRKDEGDLEVKGKEEHKDKGNHLLLKLHSVELVYCMLTTFV